jgi:hypothetical protein
VRAPHMMWAGDAACAIVPQADRDKAWRSSGGLRDFGLAFQRAENPIADGTRGKLKPRKSVLPRRGDLDALREVKTEIRYARWFARKLDEPLGENVFLALPLGPLTTEKAELCGHG